MQQSDINLNGTAFLSLLAGNKSVILRYLNLILQGNRLRLSSPLNT